MRIGIAPALVSLWFGCAPAAPSSSPAKSSPAPTPLASCPLSAVRPLSLRFPLATVAVCTQLCDQGDLDACVVASLLSAEDDASPRGRVATAERLSALCAKGSRAGCAHAAILRETVDEKALDNPCREGDTWACAQGLRARAKLHFDVRADEVVSLDDYPIDEGEALCERGSGLACLDAAVSLTTAKKDSDRARKLAMRACDSGWPGGCFVAAQLSSSPIPLLQRGCRAGHVRACDRLAELGDPEAVGLACAHYAATTALKSAYSREDACPAALCAAVTRAGASPTASQLELARKVCATNRLACIDVANAAGTWNEACPAWKDDGLALELLDGACRNLGDDQACESALKHSKPGDTRVASWLDAICSDQKRCLTVASKMLHGEDGYPKHEGVARPRLESLCKAGAPAACSTLAYAAFNGAKNLQGAFALAEKSCPGDADGCRLLGYLYLVGEAPIPRDRSRAYGAFVDGYGGPPHAGFFKTLMLRKMERLCVDKEPPSSEAVPSISEGQMLQAAAIGELGIGATVPDLQASHYCMAESCKLEEKPACVAAAEDKWLGRGTKKDVATAKKDLEVLCKAGEREACGHLAWMTVTKQIKAAGDPIARLNELCDSGEMLSCTRLGVAREQGLSGKADTAAAKALYRAACDKGHGEACRRLAKTVPGGDAAQLLERGCRLGDADACAGLAKTQQDPEAVKTAVARGCALGSGEACLRFSEITGNADLRKRACALAPAICK